MADCSGPPMATGPGTGPPGPASGALLTPPRDSPPPDYNSAVNGPQNPIGPRGYPPAVSMPMNDPPPEYSVAAHLPSYEQAELSKDKLYVEDVIVDTERGRITQDWDEDGDSALLGNDFVFCTAFITAFLFNWVGFLLLMCFCHTIAARYGALAGFGLSLAKWTLIVKRSTDLVRTENAWLWWLVLGFGFLICTRACVQYLQIKKTWRHLSRSARERLFFFY